MQTGQTAQTYTLFVGVDIAATTAMVCHPAARGKSQSVIYDRADARRLYQSSAPAPGDRLCPRQVLVVMEATGSYWISLATRLVHEGFAVSVINPAQAHHFAKALLKRAKTDAIDAQTLAQLAMVLQPEPWTPPPQIYYALQQRLAQRDDLLNLRQQVRNQLHALVQHPEVIAEVRARMEHLLATFEAQLTEVEAEITAALCQDSAWAAAATRLQSIKGVGWVTAAWTLVTTLNLTSCDTVDALTAYAGLAPMPRQSGIQCVASALHWAYRQRPPPHRVLHGDVECGAT